MNRKKVSVLCSAVLFAGLVMPGIADAIEIGDLITPAIEAVAASDAVIGRVAEQSDIPTSFIINPTLAQFGDAIAERIATQADVDATVINAAGNRVVIDDTILARDATHADVNAGAMIDPGIIQFDMIDKSDLGHGIDGDSVIINGREVAIGEDTFDRIAKLADVTAEVYSSGTPVALGDEVFVGKVVEYADGESYVDIEGTDMTISDGELITFRSPTSTEILDSETDLNVGVALNSDSKIYMNSHTGKNSKLAVWGEVAGERIATTTDVENDVRVNGEIVTSGDTIPERIVTQADINAGALIDPTEIAKGDLVFYGYANQDDVDNKETTGNKFVEEGDIILSRKATQEDVDAKTFTGDSLIKLSELIPGAVVVDADFLAANPDFKIDNKLVAEGDIIFLASDAKSASDAIPAVYYTAGNAVDDKLRETVSSVTGVELTDEELAIAKAEMLEMSPGVSDLNRLKVVSLFSDFDIVKISESDFKDVQIAGFALSTNEKAFEEFSQAVHKVAAGTMTADEVQTKLNSDVNSGSGVSISGLNAIGTNINNHQSGIIANSGRYNSKNTSVADVGHDTGVASGSANMNTGVWFETFISESTMDVRDGIAGYEASAIGFSTGVDTVLDTNLSMGFALSYANTDVEGDSVANSKTEGEQYQGTLYGIMMQDDYFINGSIAYATSKNDTSRTAFGGDVTGSYNTDIYSVDLGVGMPMLNGNTLITPQMSVKYASISPDSYTEDGPGALNVSPEDMNLLYIKAGVGIDSKIKLDGGTLIPKMRVLAEWDVLREKAESTSSWVSTGVTLAPLQGAEPSALGGIVGLGFDYTTDDGIIVLSLDYDLKAKPDFTSHAGTAKIRVNF